MSQLRHAVRQMLRHPGFSLIVVVMLALGIGATTAIFSLFHQILLAPLPVTEPGRLVNLAAPGPKTGSTSCSSIGDCEHIFSYPMFRDLEAGQDVFTGLAAHRDFAAQLASGETSLAGTGVLVSGHFFDVLGLTPALGRLIGPADEPGIGVSAVAVLDYDYWQDYLGGEPGVLDDTITVNGQTLTVIGVAPPGFRGVTLGLDPQVYVPVTLRWLMEPTRGDDSADRRSYWLYLFGRLDPGLAAAQATAGINRLYAGILDEVEAPLNAGSMSPDALDRFRARRIELEPGGRGQTSLPATVASPLTLLLGLTAIVLIIVCVNLANLLLARGVARAGEIAIRSSIGASRSRIVRELLSESAVPAIAGGACGLLVAAAALGVAGRMVPLSLAAGLEVSLDTTAVVFATGMTVTAMLLFSVVPALEVSRSDPRYTLHGYTRQGGTGRGTAALRTSLSTAQIAFSMLLLVLAGLFARSLANVASVDLGLRADSLVTFTISPRRNGESIEAATAVFDEVEQALAAEPGVERVASARIALLTDRTWRNSVKIDGVDDERSVNAGTNAVSPGFFEALGMPLLSGRDFAAADAPDSPRVAIVNESFARAFGIARDAVNRSVVAPGADSPLRFEIVGVVADAAYSEVKGQIPPQIFIPRSQFRNLDALTYYVRSSVATDAAMATIRRVVRRIDPELPLSRLMTMPEQLGQSVYLDRMVAALAAAFAVLATVLAALGLYGVLAYNVAQRTRELGIRLALGARPGELRAMVLKRVGGMAAVGGGVGLVLALVLGRVSEAMLFGVSGYDPATFGAAALVLGAVALGAGYLPARRASSVAPMAALRHE